VREEMMRALEFCFCRDTTGFDLEVADEERRSLAMATIYKNKTGAKPTIAIIGAGNLATALAPSLRQAGYAITQIISRKNPASSERARQLAKKVGASAIALEQARITADLIWFCVPDGAIASVASALKNSSDWKGKTVFHSSGALPSDELADLKQRGAMVASLHPMMTFVRGSKPSLAGVPFAVEGDAGAVRVARSIVHNLGAVTFAIQKKDKAAYHAWGTFASPLLTALLAATEQVAAAAGVRGKAARQRALPILLQTIANYVSLGAPGAFSGPIVRGDIETVKRHLEVLRKLPVERDVYVALARAALRYLPVKEKKQLSKLLVSKSN
jgi:predicted short-subunit dehydrogenase-like oxidoreductase (DUF2520 family)